MEIFSLLHVISKKSDRNEERVIKKERITKIKLKRSGAITVHKEQ